MYAVSSKIAHKMENDMTYNLSVAKLRENLPAGKWVGIGDDFCMFNAKYGGNGRAFEHPCRFNGLTMIYCVRGHMKLTVNLNEFEMKDGHVMVMNPGNIIKVTDVPEQDLERLEYVVVVMSSRFCSDLKFDLKKILKEGPSFLDTPMISLSEEMVGVMGRYLALMAEVAGMDSQFRDDALASIVSSMLCLVAGAWVETMDKAESRPTHQTTRSRMVLEQFLKLVAEHHTKYRNVGYYADKLCLTPKYLSKLIKNASGKSAPEWIDAYVILEAKNLLKYSDITIKEIVYRLNFPNQSVFYKFFKARTGMTPSEYRNS